MTSAFVIKTAITSSSDSARKLTSAAPVLPLRTPDTVSRLRMHSCYDHTSHGAGPWRYGLYPTSPESVPPPSQGCVSSVFVTSRDASRSCACCARTLLHSAVALPPVYALRCALTLLFRTSAVAFSPFAYTLLMRPYLRMVALDPGTTDSSHLSEKRTPPRCVHILLRPGLRMALGPGTTIGGS